MRKAFLLFKYRFAIATGAGFDKSICAFDFTQQLLVFLGFSRQADSGAVIHPVKNFFELTIAASANVKNRR